MRTLGALIVATVLGGCASSPPTQFIALSVTGATSKEHTSAKTPIAVGRVDLPAALDRPALVRWIDNNRLNIDGIIQWAGPLDRMVRRTLTLDLANRLPQGEVMLPGQPRPANLRVLVVSFERFSAGPDNTVVLTAGWSLVDSHSAKVLLKRRASLSVTARSSTGGAVAAAMSQALGKLADEMASTMDKAGG